MAIALNLLLVAALVAVLSSLSAVLGPPKRIEGDKALPYETGMPPIAPAAERMTVLYHRFAVLFVVFDVDLALLIPWALLRDRLTIGAMISMTFFILLTGFTLAYVWRKGALEVD